MGGCAVTDRAKSLVGICGAVLVVTGFACAAVSLALKATIPGERGTVSLAPGEAAELGKEMLVLKDFRVERYPSGKIRQYVSDVHIVTPGEGKAHHASISVNHPLRWGRYWLYQTAYDPNTETTTVLTAVYDQWLPLAAVGGALLVLGSLLFGLTSFGNWPCRTRRSCSDSSCSTCSTRLNNNKKFLLWPRVLCGVTAVSVPLFIIGRAVLRPDPVPALQSPLMAPHVAAYAASYVVLLFATFGVGKRLMPFGWFLMTLGLVLGALWGKICWGDFWQYDPKEMWSFATWSVYAAYFAFRRNGIAERVLRFAGGVAIILTLTWVNFSKFFTGLHSYA